MTIEQIEARLAEIAKLIETASAEEIETMSHEVDGLVAERDALRAAEETRAAVRSRVASGAVGTAAAPVIEKKAGKGADSEEYRRAWLKNMAVFRQQDGSEQRLLGDLTAEERAAFTFTTANTASVVPTVTLNRIVEPRAVYVADVRRCHKVRHDAGLCGAAPHGDRPGRCGCDR